AGRPFPRRDLLPRGQYFTTHTIEATRGCIHRCEFCVVPTAWGRPLHRPVAEVVADIRQMGARRLLFLDLNMIADVHYARELFEALIPLRLQWGGLATVAIAWDEELLDLAARSGCRGLLMGFETTNPDSLGEVRKQFNLHQDYLEVVRRVHQRGIAIMGTFIFGLDHDDTDCFARVVDFVMQARIELPRYAILTPFPGTPLFRRLEAQGRILTRDWSLYDGQHVVYRPARMSCQQLERGTEWAWKTTYSYGSIFRRLWRRRPMLAAWAANFGYRFYAYNLKRFYTCREVLAA
ncbi:MAG TPA: radical SAM protein, partial [Candidatus Nitrosotenuis sp.]|nr:radical SAM protein [Candidatus Nitrosotenuis sp.]